jgi:CRISPR-associated endonuclease/helicase Cas3
MRTPRVVVTGMSTRKEAPPTFPGGSRAVYGEYLLLRAAALVLQAAAGPGWSIPADVPGLVAVGYDEQATVPAGWQDAAEAAREQWLAGQATRAARAAQFLLSPIAALGKVTLAGLHENRTDDLDDEDQVAAVVRDGDPSVEVVLVRQDVPGTGYQTLDGRPIGPNGEAVCDEAVMAQVIGATIRLPAVNALTDAALDGLRPLPGWTADPWLRTTRALVLDADLSTRLGGYHLRYDHELGLIHTREGQR